MEGLAKKQPEWHFCMGICISHGCYHNSIVMHTSQGGDKDKKVKQHHPVGSVSNAREEHSGRSRETLGDSGETANDPRLGYSHFHKFMQDLEKLNTSSEK